MRPAVIKNKEEIGVMREGGRRLALIMKELSAGVKTGENTQTLDKLAEELVFANKGEPAFKGYGRETGNPFPATICASLDEEVVHGIPSADIVLKEGSLLKIDIGMKFDGLYVDMARVFAVGKVSSEASKLASVAEGCFWAGLKKMRPGGMMSEYSKAAQKYAESSGFSVVRNLVGHGVGRQLHEDPQIPNYHNPGYADCRLLPGMTLALEPMINAGSHRTVVGEDGWVYRTADGSLSAHYENTVLITDKGTEVLTA